MTLILKRGVISLATLLVTLRTALESVHVCAQREGGGPRRGRGQPTGWGALRRCPPIATRSFRSSGREAYPTQGDDGSRVLWGIGAALFAVLRTHRSTPSALRQE